jgi:galactofuranose transport system permease protein
MTASATTLGSKPSTLSRIVDRNRKFIPLGSTILLFAVVYLYGFFSYPEERDLQAFLDLFNTAPFLVVTVVGETFVILAGGIDLSVSGILALASVIMASLLQQGWSPWAAFPVVLVMGMTFGLVMGLFITYLKVQPFIATLAGMWLARGLCYLISDAEIRISNPTYTAMKQTRILIPGFSDISVIPKTGDYITYSVAVALILVAVGLYLAHFTKFGRTVYAMGGGNGANELSSRMMGLPVNRTKVLVYVFSGFCSAIAGILYSIYVMSGRGNHGSGFELTTIAACVIGGVALTGAEGYLFGAIIGVLVTSLIQLLMIANGQLSSYWVYIFIGFFMLLFIGVQALVAMWNEAAIARSRYGATAVRPKRHVVWYKTGKAKFGIAAASVVVAAVFLSSVVMPFVFPSQQVLNCTLQSLRTDQQKTLTSGGAVIVYERNGGTSCIDELYAIYADGKIVSDYGAGNVKNSNIGADKVTQLLSDIDKAGYFTPDLVTTMHTPCAACYTYNLTVTYNGKTRAAAAVDGTTDTSDQFWNTIHLLAVPLNVGK